MKKKNNTNWTSSPIVSVLVTLAIAFLFLNNYF